MSFFWDVYRLKVLFCFSVWSWESQERFFFAFSCCFFFRLKSNKAVINLTRLPNEGVSNVLSKSGGKGEATKTPTTETCHVECHVKGMQVVWMESTLPKTNSGNGCSDKQSSTFLANSINITLKRWIWLEVPLPWVLKIYLKSTK